MDFTIFYVAGGIILLVALTIIIVLSRYKKCPPDSILVKWGAGKTVSMQSNSVIERENEDGSKVAEIVPAKIDTSIKVYQGKGAFVWPIVQDYTTMSLSPYKIVSNVVGPDDGFIDTYVDVALTTGISSKPDLRNNAVSRFLTTPREAVSDQIKTILDGAIRHVITTMSIEDLNNNRNKFLGEIRTALEPKMLLLGFDILDINIQKIYDKVSYLDNLGKKKETEATNKALIGIAEKNKEGVVKRAQIDRDRETEVAQAVKEQEIQVKQAEKDQAVKLAEITKEQAVETATFIKEQESGKAAQGAEQRANVASANAQAEIAEAKADSDAKAQVAQANANAEAAEAEAIAGMQIRKAKATQDQAAQTTQAIQDKEAREAEYRSKKDQRKAMAERDAGVTEQNAKIDVANARAKAGQAEADADKTVRNAQVDAEMSVAENKQVRQLKVNEAEAKATEAKLNATKIIPAQKAKEEAVIAAEKQKAEQVIDAQGYAEATLKKAEVDARAIQLKMEAEAAGIEAKGKAEGAREEAISVGKARGVQEEALAEAMKIERMIQAAGGDVNALTQLRLTDHVEAGYDAIGNQFNALRDAKITVVGNPSTAGDLIGSLVSKGAPALQLLNDGLKEQVLKTFGLGKEETKELPDGSSK